jgi:lambda repressor-like predicted transcriptional regulator
MVAAGSDAEEMLRMDQVHVIRHKVLVEGCSMRRVAREMKVSRNTVRHYLDNEALVGERKASERPRPKQEALTADVHDSRCGGRLLPVKTQLV